MTDKEAAIEVVRSLPEEATFEEILEHVAIVAAIRRGEAAADAGHFVAHEDIKRQSIAWTMR